MKCKGINEEKAEEVSGGRYLSAKEFAGLDPEKKKEYLRTAKKLDPKSIEIPKELLDKVSGGYYDDDEYLFEVWDQCHRCGAYLYGHICEYGFIDYFVCKACGDFYLNY